MREREREKENDKRREEKRKEEKRTGQQGNMEKKIVMLYFLVK